MTKDEKSPEGQVTVVPTKENASIEIIPFGTSDRIRLSAAIVRQMIAQPTRTGKLPDDNQCIKFIMLCQARHLNPFEGDAFMLGYDTQTGPQFSLITAHQVFLKRAEASQKFNGMESGVIVKLTEGGIHEREGDLIYDDEKLVGGWAKVYRKNLDKPIYRRLKLSTFNTGRSRWEKDPAGMIVKCAEADALRTSFPTHLGGLYIEEEAQPIDVGGGRLEIKRAKVPKLKDKDLSADVSTVGSAEQERTTNGREGATSITAEAPTSPPAQDSKKKPANDTPSTSSPTTLKRKQKARSPSSNRAAMMGLLAEIGSNAERFMELAQSPECEWLPIDATWDSLTEEDLERFLTQDNRIVVIEALAK